VSLKRCLGRPEGRREIGGYGILFDGPCDVNMPLLYREGKKAFYRLQLEIIKNSSDESVFAWGQDTNIIPKPALSWHYGLLDENLGAFERYGDIVDEFSFRRPYTMTNKGFQVMANLISPREYLARTKVEGEDRRYPKWVLTLH
jgi:hypothetical protein